jgi:chromosome segregation ATPase
MQEELHEARLKELDQMTSERDTARAEFETMRKQRLDEFMAGFSTITNKLKEMYQVRNTNNERGNPKSNVWNCPISSKMD